MAKDKMIKNIEGARKSLAKTLSFANNLVEKIIAKVDQVAPSQENRNRVISAIVLIPLAVYAIYFSQSLFFFIAIILTILMTAEWLNLIKTSKDQDKWQLIGLAYIAIPIFCVIKLRMISSDILLWMFAVIWATDIFAFFSGKTFGGPKLAPEISPNKTWSGLAGGVVASMIIGFLSSFMFSGGVFFFVFLSALLAVIEQAGDLLESKFKRLFGVKDSGTIIPGHGGVLDRLDGMMFTAPAVLFFITIFADKFGY